MRGRPRKNIYERGERLINKKNGTTRWRFVKDVESKHQKRRAIVACDCGSIEVRYLAEITHGKSMGCRKCAEHKHGHGIRPGSLQSQSVIIGMAKSYFCNMKHRQPERFRRIKELGDGDLATGWYVEQDLKEDQ